MSLEKKIIPAYITVAFTIDPEPKIKIQEITEREVVFEDGKPLNDGTLLPPRLIVAPQKNDTITATLEDALGPIGAAAVIAVAEANEVKNDVLVRLAELGGEAADIIARLESENAAKDANIQELLAKMS